MIEDTHSTTGILKRRSPLWWWIRGHWQVLASVLGTSVVWLVVQSVGFGHYQADNETRMQNFTKLQDEVQQMHGELTQVKESQARTEGTLSAISLWAQGMSKFQTSVQEGAKEALATPVPKVGARAKH